ncbi:hypothetical protein Ancab_005185 [Ancistrocladus abbreviatus]
MKKKAKMPEWPDEEAEPTSTLCCVYDNTAPCFSLNCEAISSRADHHTQLPMADKLLYLSISQEMHRAYIFARPSSFDHSGLSAHSILHSQMETSMISYILLARGNCNSSQFSSPSPASSEGSSRRRTKTNPIFTQLLRGIVSCVPLTIVAPIERVQLLLQCQNEMIRSGRLASPYKGTMDCLTRTIKHEGVISLWRGNTATVLRCLPSYALSVALLKYYRGCLNVREKFEINKWPAEKFALFGLVTTTTRLFYNPLDYARTRLANDVTAAQGTRFSLDSARTNQEAGATNARQFHGLFDVYKKTLKSDGLAGFYRGYIITCIGATLSYGIYDRMNTSKKEKLKQKTPYLFQVSLLLGVNLVLYPINSVSRRMMMTSGEASKYKGAVDAFYQIIKHEGLRSLYRGFDAFIIKCVAVSILTVTVDRLLARGIKKAKGL